MKPFFIHFHFFFPFFFCKNTPMVTVLFRRFTYLSICKEFICTGLRDLNKMITILLCNYTNLAFTLTVFFALHWVSIFSVKVHSFTNILFSLSLFFY
ncbi:hypothetical protein Lalb_Chr08g0242081 [Lupinus albus]|uniref:Uncharacterized protein n=1 Tax=Lupinus albus TaxID=3870 RepID=A0A6A4Q4H5_LUPAL|nr:hypothetical protein Lalb_Chr08g0242081 [Lupinus albus]